MSARVYESRGVYYFDGCVRCPLAGVGSRGDFDSNRLVLDNEDSRVTVDREARTIVIENANEYPVKTVVADLTFLAVGHGVDGSKNPLAVHLKVFRHRGEFTVDLHRHLRNQTRLTGVELERFEVIATDGQSRTVLLDDSIVDSLVASPSLGLRLLKSMMAMRRKRPPSGRSVDEAGYPLVDLSMGFGPGPLSWMMIRAELVSLAPENAALIERGDIVEMLRDGVWELTLTPHTRRYLVDVVTRDLFLFGLADVPLLAEVRRDGLQVGQKLSFRFEAGRGEVGLDAARASFPEALDVARSYLEFHMLGGLLVEHSAHSRP